MSNMSLTVLAEDSLSEESDRDYGTESDDLFSSPGRCGELEEIIDLIPDVIPQSPKNALERANPPRATRCLFTKPLGESSNSTPRRVPPVPWCTHRAPVESPLEPPRCIGGAETQDLILQEIRKANSRLDRFAGQLQSLETRLTSVESNQMSMTPNSSSGTDGSAVRGKRKVPAKVSVRC